MEFVSIIFLIMITLSQDGFEYFFNLYGFDDTETIEKEFNKL